MKLDSKLRGAVYAPKPKILVLVLDETLTRNEFGAIDHCADEIHKSDPNGDYLEAVIVTMNPKNSVSQGFVDKDGNPFDYASRYFGPWVGVPEDPATGSSHSYLAELWKNYINKEELYAYQHYPGRGAQFRIRPVGDRVEIVGKAVTMVEGRAHF
ncbi:hypothetical protein L596_002014 [Steinernema carpocapsae]|uniref:Phenazine biosynthesis-like domain-containing protein n=1 Tax=Steinernema carpocapsae TaxID=34508 RepID=A0A4U8UQL7_STECR|nr:hypothetical protein L596_002014 [Steinernema carpocapsae]